jgi:hypothetical protein
MLESDRQSCAVTEHFLARIVLRFASGKWPGSDVAGEFRREAPNFALFAVSRGF